MPGNQVVNSLPAGAQVSSSTCATLRNETRSAKKLEKALPLQTLHHNQHTPRRGECTISMAWFKVARFLASLFGWNESEPRELNKNGWQSILHPTTLCLFIPDAEALNRVLVLQSFFYEFGLLLTWPYTHGTLEKTFALENGTLDHQCIMLLQKNDFGALNLTRKPIRDYSSLLMCCLRFFGSLQIVSLGGFPLALASRCRSVRHEPFLPRTWTPPAAPREFAKPQNWLAYHLEAYYDPQRPMATTG